MIHQEVQQGIDVPFEFKRYNSIGQVIPTSGTFDVKDNSGSSKQSGSLVIDSEGTMTFTFLTANNTDTGFNFKIELSYVIGGDTTNETILFDVVATPLINLVTDKDLFVHIPVLRDRVYEKNGESTSDGSTTTIIDVSLSADERDWTGARGRIVQGDIEKEFRISAYNRSTSTITFSPAVTSTVTGNRYNLRQSFTDTIDDAFNNARQDVRNKIGCTAGYIDSNVIKNMTVYYALMTASSSNIEIADDKWSLWMASFESRYKREFEKIAEPYDKSGEGNISANEDQNRPSGFISQVRR